MDLSRLIPVETAHKLPDRAASEKGRLLTIAMTDPLDINALDTIEMLPIAKWNRSSARSGKSPS